jgi:hypothetical protein
MFTSRRHDSDIREDMLRVSSEPERALGFCKDGTRLPTKQDTLSMRARLSPKMAANYYGTEAWRAHIYSSSAHRDGFPTIHHHMHTAYYSTRMTV